jgi:hypothetical protein
MANAITRAQVITLYKMTSNFPSTEEIKIAHRYSSGNLVVYLRTITIDIFPNGNWRIRSTRTGDTLTSGKFQGVE